MGILSSLIVLLYTFIVYPFGRRSFRVWAANEITFQFAKWLKRSHRFIGAVGDPDNTGVINPNPLYRLSALSLYSMLKIEFAVLFRTLFEWAGRLNPWNLNLKITRFHIIGLKSEMWRDWTLHQVLFMRRTLKCWRSTIIFQTSQLQMRLAEHVETVRM